MCSSLGDVLAWFPSFHWRNKVRIISWRHDITVARRHDIHDITVVVVRGDTNTRFYISRFRKRTWRALREESFQNKPTNLASSVDDVHLPSKRFAISSTKSVQLFTFIAYIAYVQLSSAKQQNSNRGLVLLVDILYPMVFLQSAPKALSLSHHSSSCSCLESGRSRLSVRFRRGSFMILGRPSRFLSVNRVDKVSPSVIGC